MFPLKELRMRRTLIVAASAMLALAAPALAAESIRGTADTDTLPGTAEADAIFARAGDDIVNADAGDDRVHGGRGADKLNGEDGNDRLKGGGGADEISGGAGDDTIDGRGDGRTADVITCGEGTDTVRASRNDQVAEDCEQVKQPGKPAETEEPAAEQPAGNGPKGDEQPPFDEDGKAGKGPKPATVAAFAQPDPARAACRAEKHGMGTKLFKRTYAAKSTSKAMSACIAQAEAQAEAPTEATTEARVNAAQTCKTERDADPAAFTEKYGTNKNKKNAFGKCVSTTAKADGDEA
jgi:hypothetical protein